MLSLSLGREEASGVRVGMEGGDGGKRRSRSGPLRPLHNGEDRAGAPSTQPPRELITCGLCNLSQQEKGKRQNSSSGSHNRQNNRLVPSRSQWEERGRILVMPKAEAPPFPSGPPRSPLSPLLRAADILTSLTASPNPGDGRGLPFQMVN